MSQSSYHKHPQLEETEVNKIMSFERIKRRIENENISVQKVSEEEEIRMAKRGLSSKDKADGMYQDDS